MIQSFKSTMSSILSGEQLVHAHAKAHPELPTTGVKEFQPNHSWLENKQIQSLLEQRKSLLEEERVEKWSSLMVAQWIPEKRKAEVKTKGKHWEIYGHHTDNADWLFPEEALLLMEMNCLECLYGEVPMSIQRGYSVLLRPEYGCSPDEYRVFAHLCRTGYRVARHLPDLTVTAYERQIRLDQHLELKKTYSDSTSTETDIPRPDLPPKKIIDLPEDSEITIDSSSVVLNLDESTLEDKTIKVPEESRSEKQVTNTVVEVIDIADSSSEESSGDESSSDDSVIEIVHESAPVVKRERNKSNMEEDDDVEIIEVPVPAKKIIVATIESSDSEPEEGHSDSDSEKSYDGNWKRNRPSKQKKHFIRPASMSNLNYLVVEEFCLEKPPQRVCPEQVPDNVNGDSSEMEISTGDGINSDSIEYISIESTPTKKSRPLFPVEKSRNEILDLMPTIAQCGKILTLESPDFRLLPDSLTPKQKFYSFNTNTLRARNYSAFRAGYGGRRNFRGSRFNSYNPHYNNNFGPNQFSGNLLPNPSLTNMFGSDPIAVARGMMQFASALMMNMQKTNQNDGLMPYNPPSNLSNFNASGYSQPTFNAQPGPTTFAPSGRITYPDSPINRNSPSIMNENVRPAAVDRFNHFRGSGSENDFEMRDRSFTPPIRRPHRGHFNHRSGHSNRSRRPFARSRPFRGGAFSPTPRACSTSPVNHAIDPAYLRPDVPLPVEQSTPVDNKEHFIPLNSTNEKSLEIIDITDNDEVIPKSSGFSVQFQRRRKRKRKLQKMHMAKKKRLNERLNANRDKKPVIVFIDSPTVSSSSLDSFPVKRENDCSSLNVKNENNSPQNSSIKQELNESSSEQTIKREMSEESRVKTEQTVATGQETRVKSNNVRVSLDHDQSRLKVQFRVRLDTPSDISVSGLPIVSLVKADPEASVKEELGIINERESLLNVKSEAETAEVKTENSVEDLESNCGTVKNTIVQDTTPIPELNEVIADDSVEKSVNADDSIEKSVNADDSIEKSVNADDSVEKTVNANDSVEKSVNADDSVEKSINADDCVETSVSECERNEEQSEMEVDISGEACEGERTKEISSLFDIPRDVCEKENVNEMEVDVVGETSDSDVSRTTQNNKSALHLNEDTSGKMSSWAQVKRNNVQLESLQENEDESEDDADEEDDIRPLLRPKHCKTIGSVLSALRIFEPFSPQVPEDVPKLKISFDMYLAADFRKAQRGLPQYRIVVFGGMDPMPSPAQVHELQTRFEDSVPVLRAVVMPNSVVFYCCSNISLPVDDTSYRKD